MSPQEMRFDAALLIGQIIWQLLLHLPRLSISGVGRRAVLPISYLFFVYVVCLNFFFVRCFRLRFISIDEFYQPVCYAVFFFRASTFA